MFREPIQPYEIQYMGIPGRSRPCLKAVGTILNSRGLPEDVALVTLITDAENQQAEHLFIFWNWNEVPATVVHSGFTSGYPGTTYNYRGRSISIRHPNTAHFSKAMSMLVDKDKAPGEICVPKQVFDTIDDRRLSEVIDWLNRMDKSRPYDWFGSYIFDSDDLKITEHSLWSSVHRPRLDMDFLDLEIVGLIKNKFEDDPESAILNAVKVLEERIRSRMGDDAVENGNLLIGNALVAKAFNPDKGILRDTSLQYSERQGLFQLFAGAMGYVRNPVSHRFMDTSDSQLQCEFIYLIDLLLRIMPDVEGG